MSPRLNLPEPVSTDRRTWRVHLRSPGARFSVDVPGRTPDDARQAALRRFAGHRAWVTSVGAVRHED